MKRAPLRDTRSNFEAAEGVMDKRKAIEAYRSGLVTAQECAQILGLEHPSLLGLVPEAVQVRLASKDKVRSGEGGRGMAGSRE